MRQPSPLGGNRPTTELEDLPRGKNYLYTHFGGAEALFSYIDLQVTDSVGGTKPCKIFHLWGNAPFPPYWWVPGIDIESSGFPPRTETYISIQYSNKKKAEKHKKH